MRTQPEAAADALRAGADLALGGGCNPKNVPPGCISYGALPEAVRAGLVTEAEVDTSVRRMLTAAAGEGGVLIADVDSRRVLAGGWLTLERERAC